MIFPSASVLFAAVAISEMRDADALSTPQQHSRTHLLVSRRKNDRRRQQYSVLSAQHIMDQEDFHNANFHFVDQEFDPAYLESEEQFASSRADINQDTDLHKVAASIGELAGGIRNTMEDMHAHRNEAFTKLHKMDGDIRYAEYSVADGVEEIARDIHNTATAIEETKENAIHTYQQTSASLQNFANQVQSQVKKGEQLAQQTAKVLNDHTENTLHNIQRTTETVQNVAATVQHSGERLAQQTAQTLDMHKEKTLDTLHKTTATVHSVANNVHSTVRQGEQLVNGVRTKVTALNVHKDDMINDLGERSGEQPGKKGYQFGDITKGLINKVTGKDTYEFGDLSRWLDQQAKAKANEYTGKEEYQFGDITKEVVRRLQTGEYTYDDLFLLLKIVVTIGIEFNPIASALPVKVLVELLNLSIAQSMGERVQHILASELERRMGVMMQNAGSSSLEFTKQAFLKFTGKDQFQLGDLTKAVDLLKQTNQKKAIEIDANAAKEIGKWDQSNPHSAPPPSAGYQDL